MNLKFLFLGLVLFPLCFIPHAFAYDVEPFEISPVINTYIDTKIVVSYAFTQNVTSEAFSAGRSVWQVNIDPLITNFETSAADRFTWDLTITYSMIVDQTVTVAIFSGDTPVNSWPFHIKNNQIIFHFDITVTEQPHYPTAEELADMSIEVLENKLTEYTAQIQRSNQIMSSNMVTQWGIIIVVVGVAGLQLWNQYVARKRRREE